METQDRRDEKALDIFSALLVFVGFLAIGGVTLILAHLFIGLPGDLANDLWTPLMLLAAIGALAYLVRRADP